MSWSGSAPVRSACRASAFSRCWHRAPAPRRRSGWVHGPGSRRPRVTLTRAVECAENGRVFYAVQYKKQMDGAQWRLGAIGVAEWTGVPMRAVLERARVKPGARDVMPVGLDGGQDFRNLSARPMP